MSAGAPIDFFLQGSRGAYAAAAASAEGWQSIAVSCPRCGARYLASVARRCESDDAAAVMGYPDVAGQTLLARRYLEDECPDHAFRVRVRAFTVVV